MLLTISIFINPGYIKIRIVKSTRKETYLKGSTNNEVKVIIVYYLNNNW